MTHASKHLWDVTPKEAIAIQKNLRDSLKQIPLEKKIKYIAGADVSFNKFEKDVYAGIIVFSYPDLTPVEHSCIKVEANFPYIPGLLSFREIPSLMKCWEKLKTKPDVVMVDGHGIAHPRRLGIAAHFGLVIETPTLGCAKSILYGVPEGELGEAPGSTTDLIDMKTQEVIGVELRTKLKVKPVFISPGHLLTLKEAIEIAKETTHGYRLPELTRQAHFLVNAFRKGELDESTSFE